MGGVGTASLESSSKATPWLNVTPGVMGRTALSITLMAAGMYYLATGRKEADFGRMVTGAILSLASLACFL